MSASFYSLPKRKCDAQGCGWYDAPRGNRKHKGIDLMCNPGTAICSPVNGTVTKLGWPYAGNREIRYVEVTAGNYKYRVFYVRPHVELDDYVTVHDVLGGSQELDSMADGGTQHVHFEIMNGNDYIDPTPLYETIRGMRGYL
ncbi:MAG TPA: M23 family metallopeptidase [Candidatus Obscuribacterales bacterium]